MGIDQLSASIIIDYQYHTACTAHATDTLAVLCENADCLLYSPMWLPVIFLQKTCDILQASEKRRQFSAVLD